MNGILTHSPVGSGFTQIIAISRIVHLSKTDDGNYSIITLDTGEKILSQDSLRTLESKIKLGADEASSNTLGRLKNYLSKRRCELEAGTAAEDAAAFAGLGEIAAIELILGVE